MFEEEPEALFLAMRGTIFFSHAPDLCQRASRITWLGTPEWSWWTYITELPWPKANRLTFCSSHFGSCLVLLFQGPLGKKVPRRCPAKMKPRSTYVYIYMYIYIYIMYICTYKKQSFTCPRMPGLLRGRDRCIEASGIRWIGRIRRIRRITEPQEVVYFDCCPLTKAIFVQNWHPFLLFCFFAFLPFGGPFLLH